MVKWLSDGLEEMRMLFKRKGGSETKKEEREFKKKKANRAKARTYYRKKHLKKRGEKRGRPRMRSNEKWYKMVFESAIKEIISAKACIKSKGGSGTELL